MDDSLHDEKAIVIQSFLRGALCRERVNRLVQKLIDDILVKRKNDAVRSKKVDLPFEKESDLTKKKDEEAKDSDKEISTSTRIIEENDSSIGVINDGQKENDTDSVIEDGHNSMDDSARSIDILDIPLQKTVQDSLVEASISICNSHKIGEEMQGSVSNILSKFESNRNLNLKPPRNWSPFIKKDKLINNKPLLSPPIETFQKEDEPINHKPLLSPPIETPGSLVERQKRSFGKDAKFENNTSTRISSSEKVVQEYEIRTNMEIQQLLKDIKRIGESGKPYVTFGALFDDDKVANYYEALVGTLKASKKKGLIKYEGQFLLKGVNDKVVISIL
mmetsp:Transcript_29168/g.33530  ORF Transcript_29168/g.33530 Transcript_29168/m.33530 type:complete len:333 (-) Transcript_29168:71-1069(-)